MKNSFKRLTGTLLLVLCLLNARAQKIEEAIALSHKGQYAAAEKIFAKLIGLDGNNTGLLTASGFNSAWANNYALAKQRFLRAQQLQPANTDAAKGLAYTYLYAGEFSKAAAGFERLLATNPASEEFHIAAALAYLNSRKRAKAAAHFKEVLRLNNKNAEAKEYLAEIKNGTGVIDIAAMAGLSGSGGQSKFGLRHLQVGYQVNPENYVYARYDNSLSLDNFFFLKNNYNVNAIGAGFYSRWHKRIGSKIEFGHRNLSDGIQQNLWQTEQVLFLPADYIIKFGGSVITSNILDKEWMAMASIAIPITEKIKAEPHYYYIKRFAVEHRFVLNVSYHFNNYNDIAFGMFMGTENNHELKTNNTVAGGFAYSNFHIKGPLYGTTLLRYEKDAAGARNAFIAAAGLKIKLNTK